MSKLKLYHYWRSGSSWRVRWVFAVKKVDCEYIPVSLLNGESESPEHLKRNPLGYVPVLELPDPANSGKSRFLSESLAIMEWCDETYAGPSILSTDPYSRAKIRSLSEIINSDTQPLQNLGTQARHSDDKDEQKKWVQYWIRNGLHAYEKLVEETAGKYSVGDELTMADICLVPQCYAAERYFIDVAEYPTITRIRQMAMKSEGYRLSEPERFKPADA
ncbi:MAG: maleylacetoacetate isomerase [Methylotenera sp.]|nr:maleylacetoacetate isomerase [Oligoflexia bacterium]